MSYDRSFDPYCTDVPPVLYACFIGDGYADVQVNRADDGYPESSRYWHTPRNAEVGCPTCNAGDEPPGPVECEECGGSGADGDVEGRPDEDTPECYECRGKGTVTRDCPTCEGCGYVHGEPFTVTRYTFSDEDTARACWSECEHASDGYDRAAVLKRYVSAGKCAAVDVLEWSPDWL